MMLKMMMDEAFLARAILESDGDGMMELIPGQRDEGTKARHCVDHCKTLSFRGRHCQPECRVMKDRALWGTARKRQESSVSYSVLDHGISQGPETPMAMSDLVDCVDLRPAVVDRIHCPNGNRDQVACLADSGLCLAPQRSTKRCHPHLQ